MDTDTMQIMDLKTRLQSVNESIDLIDSLFCDDNSVSSVEKMLKNTRDINDAIMQDEVLQMKSLMAEHGTEGRDMMPGNKTIILEHIDFLYRNDIIDSYGYWRLCTLTSKGQFTWSHYIMLMHGKTNELLEAVDREDKKTH